MAEILIVDDSDIFRLQLKKTLEEDKHTIVEANNGFHGLETLKSNKNIRIVLCDVNMPEMDGLTMCKKMKETSEIGTVPVVMLTTEASQEMKSKGKELGVVCWIIKPYNGVKLLEAIKKILSRTAT